MSGLSGWAWITLPATATLHPQLWVQRQQLHWSVCVLIHVFTSVSSVISSSHTGLDTVKLWLNLISITQPSLYHSTRVTITFLLNTAIIVWKMTIVLHLRPPGMYVIVIIWTGEGSPNCKESIPLARHWKRHTRWEQRSSISSRWDTDTCSRHLSLNLRWSG